MKCFGREKVGLLKGIYEQLACLLASNQFFFFCFVLFNFGDYRIYIKDFISLCFVLKLFKV